MRNKGSRSGSSRTKVLVVTADAAFEEQIRSTFAAAAQIELAVLQGSLAATVYGICSSTTRVGSAIT